MADIVVGIHARDPISEAGIASELRIAPGIRIANGDLEEVSVALVVADEIDEDAVRVLRAAQRRGAGSVVVVSRIDERGLLAAVEAGAGGFLRRSEASASALLQCVRGVAAGEGRVPSDLLGRLLGQIGRVQRQVLAPRGLNFAGLTDRESECAPARRRRLRHRRDRVEALLLGAHDQERDPRRHDPPQRPQPLAGRRIRPPRGVDLSDAPALSGRPARTKAGPGSAPPRGGAGSLWADGDPRGRRVAAQARAPSTRQRLGRRAELRGADEGVGVASTSPTVNLYLYDLREDVERREVQFEPVRDETGRVIERRPPPPLPALVPRHRLDAAPRGRAPPARLAARLLPAQRGPRPRGARPRARGSAAPRPAQIAHPPAKERSLADVWSALGGELKAALDLVVDAPFDAQRVAEAGPPVLEPMELRVRRASPKPAPEPAPSGAAAGGRARAGARGAPRSGAGGRAQAPLVAAVSERWAQLAEAFTLEDADVELLRAIVAPDVEGGERRTVARTIEHAGGRPDDVAPALAALVGLRARRRRARARRGGRAAVPRPKAARSRPRRHVPARRRRMRPGARAVPRFAAAVAVRRPGRGYCGARGGSDALPRARPHRLRGRRCRGRGAAARRLRRARHRPRACRRRR